ncbi:hypothetical protein HDU87_001534 [Geranomyces variabilis]|uniref:Uncharacterized protein n=1 Tax=Geranomyces variabilis TaxID=109894 RepID=A0AAD5XTS4_9FUNG|nr:hypothetical protein HDU87_001534 [Geranomyces variabilis]
MESLPKPALSVDALVAVLINEAFPTVSALSAAPQFLAATHQKRQHLLEKASKQAQSAPQKISGIVQDARSVKQELMEVQRRREELERTLERTPVDDPFLVTLAGLQLKLEKLKAAKSYVDALLRVDELSTHLEQSAVRDVEEALIAYDHLRAIWRAVHPANGKRTNSEQNGGEEEADLGLPLPFGGDTTANLVHFVEETTQKAHALLKAQLAKKLEDALDSVGWPKAIALEDLEAKLHPLREAFGNLILLQSPERRDGDPQVPLAPIEVLLQAPILHFKFHFQGDRPTNRLDKPEWAFTRVLTTIRDHSPFLCGPIQQLLEENGYPDRDAKNEFIYGLLGAVMHKLRIDAPKLLLDIRLFSHAVKETLAFDAALREIHLYVQPDGQEWKGCASVFTERPELFAQWIQMELAASRAKFEEAVEADEAWEFADEAISEADELRPTQSAECFVKILEAITDRYKLLPDLLRRISFLNELQLPLLENYLQEVRAGIKRHVSSFHPANTPGASDDSKTGRVTLLCRYASSLHYIASVLKDWGDQPFLIDFWEEIRERTAVEGEPDEDIISNVQGSVFDEVVAAYGKCVNRLQDLVLQDIMQDFIETLWQYDRRRNWVVPVQDPASASQSTDEISPELCPALDSLSRYIPALRSNLPHPIFQHILRELATRIDEHLFRRIVLRGRFNAAGAMQLEIDLTRGLFAGVFRRWHPKPAVLFKRLNESLILLTMPMNPPKSVGHQVPTMPTPAGQPPALVSIVEALLEGDEDGVRTLLDQIGVFRLTVAEVQDVVNRLHEVEALFKSILGEE